MKQWINKIQSWVESKLEKDKLEHFFIMSFLSFPIAFLFKSCLITILFSIFVGILKESIDKFIRKTEWNWEDLFFTILAGLLQSFLL